VSASTIVASSSPNAARHVADVAWRVFYDVVEQRRNLRLLVGARVAHDVRHGWCVRNAFARAVRNGLPEARCAALVIQTSRAARPSPRAATSRAAASAPRAD
jgi:hypothetical protein